MRASLGVHPGPLYVGTGNLLKSKPKKRGSNKLTPGQWLIISPFLLLIFAGMLLWYGAIGAYKAVAWLIRRAHGPQDAVPAGHQRRG